MVMSFTNQTEEKTKALDASPTCKSCYGKHAGGQRANLITRIECMMCLDEDKCVEETMSK